MLRSIGPMELLVILLVALLWPLDIAVRRITLGPRQLLNTAVALARERGGGDLEVGMPTELARLRDRVASTRRRHVLEGEPSKAQSQTCSRMVERLRTVSGWRMKNSSSANSRAAFSEPRLTSGWRLRASLR